MKKLISVIIAIVTIFSVLSVSASADFKQYFTERNLRHAEKMADAIRNFKKDYSFGDKPVTYDDFVWIKRIVDFNYPEIFTITGGQGCRYYYRKDNATGKILVTSVEFMYAMDKKTYTNIMNTVVEPWLDKVVSCARSSFSDLEYAVFFHDYLCSNYTYDESLRIHSLHEFISRGTGVCQSYMYAYMALLRHVGIEVTWVGSENLDHIWNQVKIDGEWYNVDATWDDPIGSIPGKVNHSFFLKSDAAFRNNPDNPHRGWGSVKNCSSTKYDNVDFGRARSSYVFLNGKWYYVMNDGDIYVTDSPVNSGTKIRDYNYTWFAWGSDREYYINKYSCLMAYEGRLYMNTPTAVIRIDPNTGTDTVVYQYTGGRGYIYGMAVDLGANGVSGAAFQCGNVRLAVTPDPGYTKDIIKYTLPAYYGASAGDANGDSKLNIKDVSLLLRYLARWDVGIDRTRADFDEDGKVNISDVSKMMKRLAGWF